MSQAATLFAVAYLAAEGRARPESIALMVAYDHAVATWTAAGAPAPQPREIQEARQRITEDEEANVLLTLRQLMNDARAFADARSAVRDDEVRALTQSGGT